MEKPDVDKLFIYVSRPSKKAEETYGQLLRSIAILGYCLDRRLEKQGQEPVYEAVFKKKKRLEGQTVSVIIEYGSEPLVDVAAMVAEGLSKQFPQYCSPVEWRARTRMFQHVSVKDLPRIKEGMLQNIERLKHVEDLQEVNRAYDYVRTNIPELKHGTFEEESKNWLDIMLALKEAGFSFYAAREAADLFALGKDVHFYSGKSELKHTRLPSTWNNEAIKDWREMDQERTQEKEAREAKSQEEIEQRKADITRAKPPKIQVTMTSAKEPSTQLPKCPEGQYWSHEAGKCLPLEPTDFTCPEGQYYSQEQGKCVPIKPLKPEPEAWNKPTVYRKVEIDNINKGLQ